MTSVVNEDPTLLKTPNNEEEIINEEPYYQPDFFGEHSKYLTLVETLLSANTSDTQTLQNLTNQVIQLLEPFQAYSQLLDTYLHSLTSSIFQRLELDLKTSYEAKHAIEQFKTYEPLQYHLSKIIYTLMKVRGWKTIVKLMPHNVHLIEPIIFNLIHFHPIKPSEYWESKYVLMIWLSFVLMNPFDLSKVDSGDLVEGEENESLVDLIYNYGTECFKLNGKPSDSATILISRLLIRKDTFETLFPTFFNKCKTFIASNFKKSFGNEVLESTSLLKSLIYTLKFGNRLDFLPYQSDLFQLIDINDPTSITYNSQDLSPLLRKLIIKLIQRIGLVILKPLNLSKKRIRGIRSLGISLNNNDNNINTIIGDNEEEEEDSEDNDLDIPPELEPLLGTLLEKLGDTETIVRWSTSKALGRITQRLPTYMHTEIIEAILESMEDPSISSENTELKDWSSVDDTYWHGACLSLAELSRRGLLSPNLLSKTIDKILLALKFEQKRGSRIIGANVRDAACFCLWSFARAYSSNSFLPFAQKISTNLIICALFDRELQVRRASSAAYQELVGRLGIFPNGIKLVGLVDYFSVGNINRSYLSIAYEVAKLEEYQPSIISYLIQVGCIHWDNDIRLLSSELLNKIIKLNSDKILEFGLPKLISYIKPPRLPWIYHGSLLGISSLLNGWINCQIGDRQLDDKLTNNLNFTYHQITQIITNLPPSDFTDFGTNQVLEGACQFIENLSDCQWPTKNEQFLLWLEIIKLTLERSEERLRISALKALNKLTLAYPINSELLQCFIDKLQLVLNGNLDNYLEGWLLSFGEIKFQEGYILDQLLPLIQKLEVLVKNDKLIIEFRKSSFISINKLFLQLIKAEKFDLIENWISYAPLLIEALNDYSIDSRGDVGSWLRQEAFIGAHHLIQYFKLTHNPSGIHTSFISDLVGNILQQSVEKIDRIRQFAGDLLFEFINSPLNFNGKGDIESFFKDNEEIEWTSPKQLFPLVMPLLKSKPLMTFMLHGLVVSTGTNMENLSLTANEAFISTLFDLPLESDNQSEVTRLEIVNLLVKFISDKGRLVGPSLQTLHPILEGGVLNEDKTPKINEFFNDLLDEIFEILKISTDYGKLQQLSNICGDLTFELLENPKLSKKIWKLNLRLFTHRFPKIRVYTSERLFNGYQVSLPPDNLEDFHEQIGALLLEQDFQLPLAQLLPHLKFIYNQFGLPMPTLKSKPK